MEATVLLGLILLALTVFPVIYFARLSTKGPKESLRELNKMAEVNNLNIDQSEAWNNKAVGLDLEHKRFLFLSRNTGAEPTRFIVNLKNIRSCRVHEHDGQIDLVFEARSRRDVQTLNIRFYDSDQDEAVQSGRYLIIAKKWRGMIEAAINHQPHPLLKSA